MDCSMPGFPVHHQLLELAQTHVHQASDAIPSSYPLLSPSPSAFNLSHHQSLFQWVSSSHQVAKYWISASASVLPTNVQDWFPLGWTPCSPRDSQWPSLIPHYQFFSAQLSFSHPYMTTGKTIALTRWTFVSIVTSLLFNKRSRFVIAFLPKSKHLLISWLQSPPAMILEPKEKKVCHCFHCFPIYLPWSDGTRWHDINFLNAEF